MAEQFKNHPKILENTQFILDQCSFNFDFETPKNKIHFTRNKKNDDALLRKFAYDGLEKRYPEKSKIVLERIEKEL